MSSPNPDWLTSRIDSARNACLRTTERLDNQATAATLPAESDYADFAAWLDRVCKPLGYEVGDEYQTADGERVTIEGIRYETWHCEQHRYYLLSDGRELTAAGIRNEVINKNLFFQGN